MEYHGGTCLTAYFVSVAFMIHKTYPALQREFLFLDPQIKAITQEDK